MATAKHTTPFVCGHCGAASTRRTRKRKYCSPQCSAEANIVKKRGRTQDDLLTCKHCGGEFTGYKRKYCNSTCRQKAADQRKVARGAWGSTGKSRRHPNPIIDGKRECLDCGEVLPLAQYPEAKHSKSGHRGVCRSCFAAFNRMRRQLEKSRAGLDAGKLMRDSIRRGHDSRMIADQLGYTIGDLKRHLERQFAHGMTWERFIAGEIHIDHITPRSAFDLTNPDDWQACWALSNLRPCWAGDNLSKGARRIYLL